MPGSFLSCLALLHRTRHVASGGTRSRRCRYSVSRSHLGHSDLRAGLSEHCTPADGYKRNHRGRPLRSDSTSGALDDANQKLGVSSHIAEKHCGLHFAKRGVRRGLLHRAHLTSTERQTDRLPDGPRSAQNPKLAGPGRECFIAAYVRSAL